MESFLTTRTRPSKRFLGVIGSYLVEILDDDPVIQKVLATSKHKYSKSPESRFTGLNKRMVLKTFSGDAIIIVQTKSGSVQNDQCELFVFFNKSLLTTKDLVEDARALAKHRWKVISF